MIFFDSSLSPMGQMALFSEVRNWQFKSGLFQCIGNHYQVLGLQPVFMFLHSIYQIEDEYLVYHLKGMSFKLRKYSELTTAQS